MTMTTEERVARALAKMDGKDPDALTRSYYVYNARAAIKEHLAALADAGLVIVSWNPSVAAQNIGNEAIDEAKNAGYVYRAMIAKERAMIAKELEEAEAAMETDHD